MAKKNLNITKYMAQKIPYIKVYEEAGLIESAPHIYTIQYELSEIIPSCIDDYEAVFIQHQLEQLLNFFSPEMKFQFTTFSAPIEMKSFLSGVLISPEYGNKDIDAQVDKYNSIITNNVCMGHNNMSKHKYLILSIKKDIPEEAIEEFDNIEEALNHRISQIYGVTLKRLSTIERLEILYTMFNPGETSFGVKADIDGSGFSLKNLKYMKLTTKDMVAPSDFDTKYKDYIILNKNTYVRSFFVNSVPSILSSNFISDLTSVSSRMIFSSHYEALDSELGFELTKRFQTDNTKITEMQNFNSAKDRRNKTVIQKKESLEKNEYAYFNQAALELFKESVASGHNTMMCSYLIVLYSDNLDNLDRDSQLLKLSASKFACTVKCLDEQQLKGFQSALPLGNCKVDVKRIFPISKLASSLPPINVQDALQAHGKFCGINSINDNLIFINRKNGKNLNGLISGVKYSGKTFQNKREIFNAALNPKEEIIIISTKPKDYVEFVEKLSGNIVAEANLNIFNIYDEYGLNENPKVFKSYFLEALLHQLSKKSSVTSVTDEALEEEVAKLTDLLLENRPSYTDVFSYINKNRHLYPLTSAIFKELNSSYIGKDDSAKTGRIKLYTAITTEDLIVLLENAWNQTIANKKNGKSTSVFVDSIDTLLFNTSGSDYLLEYMKFCNQIKSVLTMVIDDATKLIANDNTLYTFEEVINNIGYFKLLNQGPIERKKYTELLNIPNSLVNHITNMEPGKGLIITAYTNIAFDDSFVEDAFYDLFKEHIIQYGDNAV